MKASHRAFLFGLLIFGFLAGIGAAALDNSQAAQLAGKGIYRPGKSVKLTGWVLYRTWDTVTGEMINDSYIPCDATLKFLEDWNIKYTFVEHRTNPDGTQWDNGPYDCYGTMIASGALKFKFPAPLVPGGPYITDVITMHVCATQLLGPGINEHTFEFSGMFDGNIFDATTTGFMVWVASPCPSNDIFDPALHPGPLHWTFGYALTKADDDDDQ